MKKTETLMYNGRKKIRIHTKRPKRDTVINSDDILNLKIALAVARDLEHFLSMV